MFKSGFVTIIGRPNVGKSTLLNQLMGEKLSIVSSKPQTTRNSMNIILNGEDYQIVFVDTPGIHKPRHKLGEYMVNAAKDAAKEVDLVLFLTTPGGEVSKSDALILEDLKKKNTPVFLVVNKVDENTQDKVAKTLASYSSFMTFDEILPISALKGKNVDALLELMVKRLPEGPKYYPDDITADVQERFIVSEIIREKALRLLNEEVPHGIAIDIIEMKETDKNSYHIEADLVCEKDSHKAIIIGKNGQTLKKIGQYARMDIENFLNSKVYLKIFVKVRKDWRDNPLFLREFGYKKNK